MTDSRTNPVTQEEAEIDEVVKLLDILYISRRELAETREIYENSRLAILAEVQPEIDALMERVKPRLEQIERSGQETFETMQAQIETLEKRIRILGLLVGASVRGLYLRAEYHKGRTTFPTDKMMGYAAAHPEVMSLAAIGEPSIQIKELK